MSQRVTLEHIAQKTGVSLATVSLVLRDKPGINTETRQRVIDAARMLGYRKRPLGTLAGGEGLRQIGMLHKVRPHDLPQSNQFYAPVVAGIEAACRKYHINLLYATLPVDEDNHAQELPRMLVEDDLDGLLLVGAFIDATIAQLMERRTTPLVLVDGYAPGTCYDSVVSDNFRGAYEAVGYLIARGHRHIGIVGSLPNGYPSIGERRRGYEQALVDNGIAERYYADSHISDTEAAAAATALLQQSPAITALFCCNDLMALKVIQAAQALGRRVPDDLSLIGFDNIEMAEHVTPALTTMHVDKVSMGRLAVQLMINRADVPGAACATTTLRPTLVERASVRSIDP